MDHIHFLDKTVALDDIYLHPAEKILFFTENGIRFSQESPHSLSIAGTGGINGDHKLLQTVYFLIFQRLDQRKIPIMLHPIIIKNIIKALRIQLHFLPQSAELLQKFPVIIFTAVDLIQFFLLIVCLSPCPALHTGLIL